MQKYNPLRIGTAVVVLVLFIGVCIIPSTVGVDKSSVPTFDDNTPPVTTHTFTPEVPDGENDWYASNVLIELNATDEESGVNTTYYKIHQYEDWVKYSDIIIITEDDYDYSLYYYSIDNSGNTEDVKGPFDFKIDQTPPTIYLSIEHIVDDTYMIIAEVEDETSGIERVEFYINDILEFTDYEAPYEYTCELDISSFTSQVIGMAPIIGHPSPLPYDKVAAIVYDYAGNSAMNEIPTIIEEEDVRNYIEKSSEEDCGCEDDRSEFKWFFPVICTLLFPIWTVAIFIFFSSHRMFGGLFAETMAQIGHNLNCFWKLG